MGLLAAFAILIAAVVVFRAPLAGVFLRQALGAAGVERPTLKVRAVSLDRLTLADIRAGADPDDPDIAIDRLETRFDWRRLLADRELRSFSIGPGTVRIDIAADGQASVAGYKLGGAPSGEPLSIPFETLAIDNLEIVAAARQGKARALVNGGFSAGEGGAIDFEAQTDSFAALDVRLRNTAITGRAQFEKDAQTGAATINLVSANIAIAESPALAFLSRSGDAEPIRSLKAAGRLNVAFGDGRLSVAADPAAPLRLIADRGDEIILTGVDGAPLYQRDKSAARLTVAARGSGRISGEAKLEASSPRDGRWRYQASAALESEAIASVALGPTTIAAKGALSAAKANGDVAIAGLVRSAEVGRLRISDASLGADLKINIDFRTKTISAANREGDCVRLDRARFILAGQDTDASLSGARLCRADGPLVAAGWGDPRQAELRGTLSAKSGAYRMGATKFEGAPPAIDFEATYDPALQLTNVAGRLSNGRVTLNGGIVATDAAGRFTARLDKQALSGDAAISRVTIAQNAKPLTVAPVYANGVARLAEEKITFDYAAVTQSGKALGVGEGAHDIRTGRGTTQFQTKKLVFAPGGLQPATLIVALKGIVGEAAGAATGAARFAWGKRPADFRSSGEFSLEELKFLGPGRAISKTVGVNGSVSLASLAPLKSAGEQTINVRLVDADALQLENGVIRFSLPGDETFRVIDAEFPWFGGRIGAYDAVAALTGAKTEMALRAADVDLEQMLAFLKIEGLSGEGIVEGVLPLVIDEGKARIIDGVMTAKGPGVLRYTGKAAAAAAGANPQAKIAFDILRELRFDELSAKINGPLDGDLNFNVVFKGTNDVTVDKRTVASPVVYRISIEAPILALIDQARVSSDFRLQLDRLKSGEVKAE